MFCIHLQMDSTGCLYETATLIYGVLMLAIGNMNEGKTYQDVLKWEIYQQRLDYRSSNNMKSLRWINIITSIFRRNMQNLQPLGKLPYQ